MFGASTMSCDDVSDESDEFFYVSMDPAVSFLWVVGLQSSKLEQVARIRKWERQGIVYYSINENFITEPQLSVHENAIDET